MRVSRCIGDTLSAKDQKIEQKPDKTTKDTSSSDLRKKTRFLIIFKERTTKILQV